MLGPVKMVSVLKYFLLPLSLPLSLSFLACTFSYSTTTSYNSCHASVMPRFVLIAFVSGNEPPKDKDHFNQVNNISFHYLSTHFHHPFSGLHLPVSQQPVTHMIISFFIKHFVCLTSSVSCFFSYVNSNSFSVSCQFYLSF